MSHRSNIARLCDDTSTSTSQVRVPTKERKKLPTVNLTVSSSTQGVMATIAAQNRNNGWIASGEKSSSNECQTILSSSGVKMLKPESVQELKKSLTLNFASPDSLKKSLSTPEIMSMLRYSSPDLEKFFSQHASKLSGQQGNTPTPTQFFYPKNVTAAQESYARGFIDALNQLHSLRGSCIPAATLMSPGFVASALEQQLNAKDEDGSKKIIESPQISLSFEQFIRTLTSSGVWSPNTPPAANSSGAQQTSTTTTEPSFSDLLETKPAIPTVIHCIPPAHPSQSLYPSTEPVATKLSPIKVKVEDQPAANNNFIHVTYRSTPLVSCTPPPAAAHFVTLSTSTDSPRPVSLSQNQPMVKRPRISAPPTTTTHFAQLGGGAETSTGVRSRLIRISDAHLAGEVKPSDGLSKGAPNVCLAGSSNLSDDSDDSDFDDVSSDARSATDRSNSSTPGLMPFGLVGPIDPVLQEKMKLARKRARNRMAATKCRRRKLEIIAQLSDQVNEIVYKNDSLNKKLEELRAQVAALKHQVEQHRANGCKV